MSNAGNEGRLPAALRERGKQVHCEAGETVFRSGKSTHSVFYVETGAVRLVRRGARARRSVWTMRARGSSSRRSR